MSALALPARARPRPTLLHASVAASLGVHVLLFGWLNRTPASAPSEPLPDVIDVDIRTPFRPRDPNDKRQPGKMRGAPAPATFTPAPVPIPIPATQTQPVQAAQQAVADGTASEGKPKDWVLEGPDTQVLEKPTLESSPAAVPPAFVSPGGTGPGGMNGRGLAGGGDGTGEAIVNRPPRLINKDEVLANLHRFYPPAERQAGREGDVLVALDIGDDGLVHGVDVLRSAGELFDEAARKVARLMRFEPELKASVPTRSRKRQPMSFRLSN